MYQLVLDAQLAAERNSKVGMSSIAALDSSEDVRARGLARLGLIESVDAITRHAMAHRLRRTRRAPAGRRCSG